MLTIWMYPRWDYIRMTCISGDCMEEISGLERFCCMDCEVCWQHCVWCHSTSSASTWSLLPSRHITWKVIVRLNFWAEANVKTLLTFLSTTQTCAITDVLSFEMHLLETPVENGDNVYTVWCLKWVSLVCFIVRKNAAHALIVFE